MSSSSAAIAATSSSASDLFVGSSLVAAELRLLEALLSERNRLRVYRHHFWLREAATVCRLSHELLRQGKQSKQPSTSSSSCLSAASFAPFNKVSTEQALVQHVVALGEQCINEMRARRIDTVALCAALLGIAARLHRLLTSALPPSDLHSDPNNADVEAPSLSRQHPQQATTVKQQTNLPGHPKRPSQSQTQPQSWRRQCWRIDAESTTKSMPSNKKRGRDELDNNEDAMRRVEGGGSLTAQSRTIMRSSVSSVETFGEMIDYLAESHKTRKVRQTSRRENQQQQRPKRPRE